ncbi:PTS sugar transporter subunit IIA [Engelhardtia mirabilis]|uniref:PTS system mannose-specific EIIBCA component n=1 Tax=Engelhardtia mirabilis TaxID=2528011 RepID=A0A518BPA0_9BACT|nr:PTS system mannose-specific EIIBCA component [Planctomycetes bacterium Pla133]QDV03131.1 PTS system mannose-specific EIIBCA component [Planctomycetes bacterium Pla86]
MTIRVQAAWKLFKPKACILKLKGTDHESIFGELVDGLIKSDQLESALAEPAIEALVAREKLASTGVGMGVAIPHVKLEGLDRALCSLSVHPDGVDWRAIDGAPVQLFFMVLRPAEATDEHDPERHLEMMRWISRLGRHDDFRRFAISAKNRTELVDLLKEMSVV